MNHGGSVSLVLKPAGPPGEALDQALRAAGFCVRVAPTVFDVVTEAHRAGGSLKHLFVGIDHWGPNEFRLLPLVRREWPATTIVAYHSPGFAYKGRVAELVGADAVLGSLDEIVQFIESLAASAEPAAPVEPPPEPPRPASAPPAGRAAPPQPQPEDSNVEDAAGDDGIDGEVIGTIELTDEELRLLLGEDEET
jgi:hypothetical protein